MSSPAPNPWTVRVMAHLVETKAAMTIPQIEAMFGRPEGGAKLKAVLARQLSYGYLVRSTVDGEQVYMATGRQRQKKFPCAEPPAEMSFAAAGRDGPRVSSVFHLAQGVRA